MGVYMTKKVCDPNKIIAQLHRVEGQVRAIERMYLAQRPVEEIVRVVMAARAALDASARMLITDKVNGCYRGHGLVKRQELLDLIDSLFQHT